jgi:acyl-CoA synthetase (NDP forming)
VVRSVVEPARLSGSELLTEPQALRIVEALGIAIPRHRLVGGDELGALGPKDLSDLSGERIVLKLVAPSLLHKTELGAVRIVRNELELVKRAGREMLERLNELEPEGLLLCEHVHYDRSIGGELLLGVRWTEDFGPVVAVGPGGTESGALAAALDGGEATVLLAPGLASPEAIRRQLGSKSVTRLATRALRSRPARAELATMERIVERLLDLAEDALPAHLLELEINPLALTENGPVALDAVARIGTGLESVPRDEARPPELIGSLLRPGSIAIVGVSRRANPGHIILHNVLRAGYARDRVTVIKPGLESFEGCRCVPDVASLPESVDLLVAAVGAEQLPALIEEVCERQAARSVILIPGGVGESRGSTSRAETIRESIRHHRKAGRAPVLNGPNCLGVRSLPGGYDTMFIPGHKLSYAEVPQTPLAMIAQSGAFAVARASRLSTLNPRYVVTVGNQIDLTLGDYLTELADDPKISVFACYVEGFRPLDGGRFLKAAATIRDSGRAVILYRAGRTTSGAEAAASHTASVAGDYAVTRELAAAAGVVVAETLREFDDLVRLFVALAGRRPTGHRLGALTNAGFESVAIGDSLGDLELATLGEATLEALGSLLRDRRLESIVTLRNPLDVTPIFDDAAFAEAARWMLSDPGVDVGLIGCVPLTGAMSTVPPGSGHGEDVGDPQAISERLIALWRQSDKPWLAVVDAGSLYDEMAGRLQAGGVPTFRTADRALRLLARYREWELGSAPQRSVASGRNGNGARRVEE